MLNMLYKSNFFQIFKIKNLIKKDETYAYNLLFLNSKIQLDKLTESLKKK
jgi:hypothetical protein